MSLRELSLESYSSPYVLKFNFKMLTVNELYYYII